MHLVYSLLFTFVMSFISKHLYNTMNSHVDKENGIEYVTEDRFPKDEKLEEIFFASKVPKVAGNYC